MFGIGYKTLRVLDVLENGLGEFGRFGEGHVEELKLSLLVEIDLEHVSLDLAFLVE